MPTPSFRYIFDPLFLASVVTYAINRFALKPHFAVRFLQDHLNDLLCIPVWVPIMILLARLVRARPHDDPPRLAEILIPLLIWSWTFESFLPSNRLGQTWCAPDPADIAFYTLGAILASVFWRWWYASPVARASCPC